MVLLISNPPLRTKLKVLWICRHLRDLKDPDSPVNKARKGTDKVFNYLECDTVYHTQNGTGRRSGEERICHLVHHIQVQNGNNGKVVNLLCKPL